MTDLFANLVDETFVSTVLTVVGIGAVALWLAAAWWTYTDMTRRTESELARLAAAGWIVLSTPAMLPLSLPIYALARPQATVAQRRSTDLVLALRPELVLGPACPGCGFGIEDGWRRCPGCATWLEAECSACGRWSSVELEICPWCAADRAWLGDVTEPAALPAAAAAAPAFVLPGLPRGRRGSAVGRRAGVG
jgi:hypothetical protein